MAGALLGCERAMSSPLAVGVLVSAGLDSACLLHRLLGEGREVHPLYVRCGLRWERGELAALRRLLRRMRRRRLARLRVLAVPLDSLYGAHWSTTGRAVPGAFSDDRAVYLPGRNVVLLSAAAIVGARGGFQDVALGVLRGNPFGDASPRFFALMARSLSQALGRRIRVLAPLSRMRKAQVIREAAGAVPIDLTVSCLRPRGLIHCGRCNKCAERKRAFREARIADPTRYQRPAKGVDS